MLHTKNAWRNNILLKTRHALFSKFLYPHMQSHNTWSTDLSFSCKSRSFLMHLLYFLLYEKAGANISRIVDLLPVKPLNFEVWGFFVLIFFSFFSPSTMFWLGFTVFGFNVECNYIFIVFFEGIICGIFLCKQANKNPVTFPLFSNLYISSILDNVHLWLIRKDVHSNDCSPRKALLPLLSLCSSHHLLWLHMGYMDLFTCANTCNKLKMW